MKILSILLMIFGVISACSPQIAHQKTEANVLQTAGAQITTFANPKEKTMSVLYGDSAAMQSAQNDFKYHSAGEHFVLVTYKQEGFYYDYDAQARGTVERVEKVFDGDVGGSRALTYILTLGKWPRDSMGNRFKDSNRIDFIFSHKLFEYPEVGDIRP